VGTLVARQKKQRNVTGYQWVIEYEGDHNDTAAPPVKGIISERSIQRLVLASSLTLEEDEGEPITDMMMMTGEEHPATVSDTSIIHSSSTNGKTNAGGSTSTTTKAKTAAGGTTKTTGKQSAATTTTVKRTKHHPPQQQHKSSSMTMTTTGGNNNSGNNNKSKGITTRLGQPVRKTILKTGILYVYLETRRAEFVRTK
jgi:hypothetical protein